MPKTIGIDLGTTFSAIAHINDDGQPEIVANREGERITPSVVFFDGHGPLVGTMAKTAAVDSPLNVCQFVKRKMGERSPAFMSEEGESYSPEEVSALILKRLKEDAEESLGQPVSQAVITVPAYFNDAQRKATEDAGQIAGLTVLRVINEPTAAALAYGLGRVADPETALVFDLGGGTFDVTILRLSTSAIDVLATGGDKNLGGFDWDNALMNLIAERALGDGADDAFDDAHFTQAIREKAEVAKKTLTSRDVAKVLFRHDQTSHNIEISRDDFNEATESLLIRTGNIMEMVAEDAKVQWQDIDKILLVGGSTRMPAVATYVEQLTGIKPSKELHPDEVVAIGAALQATLLSESPSVARKVTVTDVCSHSLGVIAVRGVPHRQYNSVVLPKDTPLPGEHSNTYHTVADNQTQLHVQVTQGEGEELDAVHIIGESTLSIPPYPEGAPIDVTFKYDANGIVHVHVFDQTANKDLGEMTIERKANLAEHDVGQLQEKVQGIKVS